MRRRIELVVIVSAQRAWTVVSIVEGEARWVVTEKAIGDIILVVSADVGEVVVTLLVIVVQVGVFAKLATI